MIRNGSGCVVGSDEVPLIRRTGLGNGGLVGSLRVGGLVCAGVGGSARRIVNSRED